MFSIIGRKIIEIIGYQVSSLVVERLIQLIREVFTDKIIEQAETSLEIKETERDALVRAISKAETNEDRKNLSILLSKLGSRLPNSDR